MSQSARTKTWQRVIDCTIGAIISALGLLEVVEFISNPRHHQTLALSWAYLLTGAGLAIIGGAVLRTVRPGRKQSIGFQLELGGWGGSAFLIFWYAIVHVQHDRDFALFGALLLIVVMLLGSWLRLVAAMHEVHKGP